MIFWNTEKTIFLAYWFQLTLGRISTFWNGPVFIALYNFLILVRVLDIGSEFFYTDIESTALNNGSSTNWFKLSRGVRKWRPLSPYLFILTAKILSSKIRPDPSINGTGYLVLNSN